MPSIGWGGKNGAKQGEQQQGEKGETEKQKNSRTWGSYMPSGKGFRNYVPKTASDTVSSFASTVRILDRFTMELQTDKRHSTHETRTSLTSSS